MHVPAENQSPVGFERPVISSDLYESRSSRVVPAIKRGLAILIAAALVTAAFGLLRYEPLAGSAPGAVSGPMVAAGSGRSTVVFQPQATFDYTFSVRNDGRWGVTVSGMQAPTHGTFEATEIFATPPGASAPTPISPFALGAGETAAITVRVTFASCETPAPADARAAWNQEIVQYRVMGVAREMMVELPYRIAIDSSNAPRC